MTIEQKAKRYDEALERARIINNRGTWVRCDSTEPSICEQIFPELKETEDEKIRKELICFLVGKRIISNDLEGIDIDKTLAWLEKQGEHQHLDVDFPSFDEAQGTIIVEKQGRQNPTNKIEPAFKVGNWIVDSLGRTLQIISVEDDYYVVENPYVGVFNFDRASVELSCHLWTIKDAKEGDVLADQDSVFIFKHKDKTGLSLCKSYCEVIGNSKLGFGFDFSINNVYPATKKQRDLLFQKMKEAGYEFDFEKKDLKKVEQKPYGLRQECVDCQFNYAGECKGSCELKRNEQKPAWSEKDEIMLNFIIEYLERLNRPIGNSCVDWLKSLRPQSHWKLSEEQIEAAY